MIFPRIEGMRIVDMSKYIDDNVYKENLSEEEKNLIYKYLYFIVYSISKAHNYLHYEKDYDDFSLYFAEWLYFRLINNEDNLPPIVSIKNYVDHVVHLRIIRWQSSDKYKILFDTYDDDGKLVTNSLDSKMCVDQIREELNNSNTVLICEDIKKEISHLPRLIDEIVEHTQYKLDKAMRHRLSVSLLLSFINASKGKNEIVLWHLSPTLKDYVTVLLNRVRRTFVDNVNYLRSKDEVCEDIIYSLIKRED